MRLPGGMVAEIFRDAGAATALLDGAEIFDAAAKGTIDVADYAGPATNYSLGFDRAFKYISLGPPGITSIYQPVDLMDLSVGMASWNKLSGAMQGFVETEVHAYSDLHHAAIQKADQEAWKQYEIAGTEITRLHAASEHLLAFVQLFHLAALLLWYFTDKYTRRWGCKIDEPDDYAFR